MKSDIWCLFSQAHWDENHPTSQASFKLGLKMSLGQPDTEVVIYRDTSIFSRAFQTAKYSGNLPFVLLFDGDLDKGTFDNKRYDLKAFLESEGVSTLKSGVIPQENLMKSEMCFIVLDLENIKATKPPIMFQLNKLVTRALEAFR